MLSPKQEMRMTGRRPKRSDQAPRRGEKINCMAFQANPKEPVMAEARAKSPPSKLRIKSGSTGTMMPNARKSNATMMRMNVNAARLGPSWAMVGAATYRSKEFEL